MEYFAGLSPRAKEFIEKLLAKGAKKEVINYVSDLGSKNQPLHRYILPSGEIFLEVAQAWQGDKGLVSHLTLANQNSAPVVGTMWSSEEINNFLANIAVQQRH